MSMDSIAAPAGKPPKWKCSIGQKEWDGGRLEHTEIPPPRSQSTLRKRKARTGFVALFDSAVSASSAVKCFF